MNTGYGTGTDSFQAFSLDVEGVGRIFIHSGHMSESHFTITIRDGNHKNIFDGTLEELVKLMEVKDGNDKELPTCIEAGLSRAGL